MKSTEVCAGYVESHLSEPDLDRIRQLPKPRTGEIGQYTDDTQLARELMISLTVMGKFHPPHYAARIRYLFEKNRDVGAGGTTRKAAKRLIDGASWEDSGTPPPAAGNGTAMRVAPLGLWFHDDGEGLVRAAHEQSMITHKATSCSAGAVAIAVAVSCAAGLPSGKKVHRTPFLNMVIRAARRFDPDFTMALQRLRDQGETFWENPSIALTIISKEGTESDKFGKWDGISPYVVPSVLWSLYSFLRTPGDYWETIKTAIACGGDVDSTAAMAGAISGAHLGVDCLPLKVAEIVNDRGTWGYDKLVILAKEAWRVRYAEKPEMAQ